MKLHVCTHPQLEQQDREYRNHDDRKPRTKRSDHRGRSTRSERRTQDVHGLVRRQGRDIQFLAQLTAKDATLHGTPPIDAVAVLQLTVFVHIQIIQCRGDVVREQAPSAAAAAASVLCTSCVLCCVVLFFCRHTFTVVVAATL